MTIHNLQKAAKPLCISSWPRLPSRSYLWVQRETPQAAGLGAQTSSLPVRDSLCPPWSDVVVFPTKPWRWLSAEGRQTTWNSMPAGYHLASSRACWKSWITWFQTIELEKINFIEAKWHSCSNWSQKTDGKSCPGCGCFYSTPRCLSKIRLRQCTLHLPACGWLPQLLTKRTQTWKILEAS